MKRTIFILMLACFTMTGYAQQEKNYNFSVTTIERGLWNEKSESWEMSRPEKFTSLFELTKNIMIQTTADSVYNFFIKESYNDPEKEQYQAKVYDDNGWEYFMILDYKNSNVRFMYKHKKDLKMIRFSFKTAWSKT
jgi:hypothetical protein